MFNIIEKLLAKNGDVIAFFEYTCFDIEAAQQLISRLHEAQRKFHQISGRDYSIELHEIQIGESK
jgi:hypothetical protein